MATRAADNHMSESLVVNDAPDHKRRPPPVYRSVILVSTSVFMGYAALVTLQHRLKNEHDSIPHPPDSTMFKHASTLNYVGNLVFRVAHNFVFFFLSPRQRVHLALFAMAMATGSLAFAMCIAKSPWIGWVFISYFLGGVSIGTFESNLLSCITPLGHGSKKWVILGMPLGFNLISVGGFLLLQVGTPLVVLYLIVMVSCLSSMLLFHLAIPVALPIDEHYTASNDGDAPLGNARLDARAADAPAEDSTMPKPLLASQGAGGGGGGGGGSGGGGGGGDSGGSSHFSRFAADIKTIGEWFPSIAPHTIALMIDMYCVSFFSSIMLYILNDSHAGGMVALLGPNTSTLVPHDYYFAVYNCFTFLGDTFSRQLVYRMPRLYHPFWYLICSALGAFICLLKIPLIAPLGIFLVFFANGAVYATSSKHIDTRVDRRVNLTALSVWLFIGDIGSVTGSNTWPFIAPLICKGVVAPHMCLTSNHTGSNVSAY